MAEAVKVSAVDVQRARLLLRLDETLGRPSPDYVRKVAEAKPANGHTNGHSPD